MHVGYLFILYKSIWIDIQLELWLQESRGELNESSFFHAMFD